MMESNTGVDIRIQSSIDIPLPENSFGNIFILGFSATLEDKMADLRAKVSELLRQTDTYWQYRVSALDLSHEDYNIVCLIKAPMSEQTYYIVAKSEYDELDYALSNVIDWAEHKMHKFVGEAIVVAAMQAPWLFMSAVDKVIPKSCDTYNPDLDIINDIDDDGYSTHTEEVDLSNIDTSNPPLSDTPNNSNKPGADKPTERSESFVTEAFAKIAASVAAHLAGKNMGIIAPSIKPNFLSRLKEDIYECERFIKTYEIEEPAEIVQRAVDRLHSGITAKAKREAFHNLPRRLTASFEKQDSRDYQIAKQTMAMFTPKENMAILEQMYRENPEIFQKYYSTALSAASRYEIHVNRWKNAYRKDFKDRYLYCIYLRNAKGVDIPVTFKNYPAYCIYMMYIIDRVQRGDDVTELEMKNLSNQFCRLYKTILCETDLNIANFYDSLAYRKVDATGKKRKGRYDDYIKDIHNTLENLVGEFDSIPLKVGHGRHLSVMPERIFIDEDLAKLKIT